MNEIEEIKDRINIVDFIGQYLQLQKSGGNFKAVCPFHQEKTPSFMVSAEKQIFKCFGCGEAGDIFTFLQKKENLTFPEALQMLADRAGVILPKFQKNPALYKKEQDTKTKSYQINKLSSLVFQKILLQSKNAENARTYLKKRKLSDEIIKRFIIGYAPRQKILEQFLYKRDYKINDLKQAGSPDRFYERIMFPIFDPLGNVIAFTGRTLSDEVQPKYLNTPETIIFHKSKVLYGLNFARDTIKKENLAIIVEGQMDVVLSHQAQIANAVACSGTALTKEHILILSRYTANIAFCFDQDAAGEKAAKKAILTAYEADISPYIITFPKKYKDVGEIVETDPAIWQKYAKIKIPGLEWLINNSSVADKKTFIKELMPYLLSISDPLEFSHYKKIIASKLFIAGRIIDEIIARYKNKNYKTKKYTKDDSLNKDIIKDKKLTIDESMIGFIVWRLPYLKLALDHIKTVDLDHASPDLQMIYKKLSECYNENCLDKKTKSCNYEQISKQFWLKLDKDLKTKVEFLVFNIENQFKNASESELENILYDYINTIKSRKNKQISQQYASLISEAEASNDRAKLKELIKEFQNKISKK